MEEIESLLLAQEARIEKHTKELDSASVNLTSHRKQFRRGTANNQGSFYPSTSPYYNNNRNNFQGNRGRNFYPARTSANRSGNKVGRHPWNSGNSGRGTSSSLQCQVCGKTGHTALDCWHRFDQDYNPSLNQT